MAIDNTLYDAFGQRQVSTIFTELNQYHVVMEVDSAFRDSTDAIRGLVREIVARGPGAAQRLYAL